MKLSYDEASLAVANSIEFLKSLTPLDMGTFIHMMLEGKLPPDIQTQWEAYLIEHSIDN